MAGRIATEPKVKAATGGAAGGAVWGVIALALIDEYVVGPHVTGDVPLALQGAILAVAGSITAYVAGRIARHAKRPDLPAQQR